MIRPIAATAALAALLAAPALAGPPQEKYERKGAREWVYSYDDGRTIEKEERKGREFKREWKRGNDEYKYERKKDGAWKEEIKEGNCKIVRERTSSGEYKEVRDC
jgi:LPS sulfotransferase NodH